MKCPTCEFTTEDPNTLTDHMMDCEGEPENKFSSYLDLGVDQVTQVGPLSELMEEKE